MNELLAIGREVKWLLNDSPHAKHPSDDRLSGIYGTVLFDELGTTDDGSLHQRNVTIHAQERGVAVTVSRGDLGVLDRHHGTAMATTV